MEFHSLSRKELQALCKKNKIPANLTNVAMADSLANLSNVEGIGETGNPQFVIQTPQTSRVMVDPSSCSVSVTRTRRSRVESGLQTPAVRSSRKGTCVAPPAYSTRRSSRLVPHTTIKPLHISSADTNESDTVTHNLKSDSPDDSFTTEAVNGESLISDDTFNADVELPSMVISVIEEKSNVASPVDVQVEHKASGDEVLDNIEPHNSFSQDKSLSSSVMSDISDGEASFQDNNVLEDDMSLAESPEYASSSMPTNAITEEESAMTCVDIMDLSVEKLSNNLGGSAVELPLSEESAVEIQVVDGEASLEVLAHIQIPNTFSVDNYAIEDSDNMKSGAVASPKDGDEKGEEIIVNVVSALITGADSFDADADQVVNPVQAVDVVISGVEVSDSRLELRQSKMTPKPKGTPVLKMVLDEDKEIVAATEEREKVNPMSKMAVEDDNKENDVAKGKDMNNNSNNNRTVEALQRASLRQLRKIVKEKIQEKARPALQSLTDNCLAGN